MRGRAVAGTRPLCLNIKKLSMPQTCKGDDHGAESGAGAPADPASVPADPVSAPAGPASAPGDPAVTPPTGAITPLTGLRVVDFSQNLAGPYATQILADLGADVIKVEPPGGDPARRWGPPFIRGQGTLFQTANRNKRSVILDLSTDEGRDRAIGLASDCDVTFQALRPGAAERFGIGYDDVRRVNPTVVYVSVLAYGEEGPLRNEPGYDPLMQARSGLMSVTGDLGGDPVRVGTSIVDLGTGMWIGVAVLGALMERNRTGRGCHVTASLLDTSLAWMSYHLTGYLATGSVPQPMGTSIAMIAPYEAFPCSDGSVMIAAGNDDIFGRLCAALELDLATHPDFAENASRVANSDGLAQLVGERTRRHSVESLLRLLSRHRVPAAPIHDVAAALADPQTAATGMVRQYPDSDLGDYVDVPMPVRWDGRRPALRRLPPRAGEHQREVFGDTEPTECSGDLSRKRSLSYT